MTTAVANMLNEEQNMTDFQLKALMAMVLEIAERCKNLDDFKNAVKSLASGNMTGEQKG